MCRLVTVSVSHWSPHVFNFFFFSSVMCHVSCTCDVDWFLHCVCWCVDMLMCWCVDGCWYHDFCRFRCRRLFACLRASRYLSAVPARNNAAPINPHHATSDQMLPNVSNWGEASASAEAEASAEEPGSEDSMKQLVTCIKTNWRRKFVLIRFRVHQPYQRERDVMYRWKRTKFWTAQFKLTRADTDSLCRLA